VKYCLFSWFGLLQAFSKPCDTTAKMALALREELTALASRQ